jgi:hypothetical protein
MSLLKTYPIQRTRHDCKSLSDRVDLFPPPSLNLDGFSKDLVFSGQKLLLVVGGIRLDSGGVRGHLSLLSSTRVSDRTTRPALFKRDLP